MTKPGFFDDTFEKLAELGTSTAKKTSQAVGRTFNPLKITEKILGVDEEQGSFDQNKEQLKSKGKHTPLDFERLRRKYADQDKQKEAALRNRLFQLVKQGEERVFQQEKQGEEREKQMDEKQKQEKERQARLKAQQEAQAEIPRGKVRRSIFSPKKLAQKQHAETKPAMGKQ